MFDVTFLPGDRLQAGRRLPHPDGSGVQERLTWIRSQPLRSRAPFSSRAHFPSRALLPFNAQAGANVHPALALAKARALGGFSATITRRSLAWRPGHQLIAKGKKSSTERPSGYRGPFQRPRVVETSCRPGPASLCHALIAFPSASPVNRRSDRRAPLETDERLILDMATLEAPSRAGAQRLRRSRPRPFSTAPRTNGVGAAFFPKNHGGERPETATDTRIQNP